MRVKRIFEISSSLCNASFVSARMMWNTYLYTFIPNVFQFSTLFLTTWTSAAWAFAVGAFASLVTRSGSSAVSRICYQIKQFILSMISWVDFLVGKTRETTAFHYRDVVISRIFQVFIHILKSEKIGTYQAFWWYSEEVVLRLKATLQLKVDLCTFLLQRKKNISTHLLLLLRITNLIKNTECIFKRVQFITVKKVSCIFKVELLWQNWI